MTLWDKVESALVGGIEDGLICFVSEVAAGTHSYEDVIETAEELDMVIKETIEIRRKYR